MFKIIYRVWGTYTSGPMVGKVNPCSYVEMVTYANAGHDGGVNMKELKGRIRKEIGDTFYEFKEIIRL